MASSASLIFSASLAELAAAMASLASLAFSTSLAAFAAAMAALAASAALVYMVSQTALASCE